jgi:hypothetical protein
MLALLIMAALACSVEWSTAHLENAGTYQDPTATSRNRGFKPADTVYVMVDLKDSDDAARHVDMVLKQVTASATSEMNRERQTTTSGHLVFTLTPPADRWERANYVVELYLDGDKKETLNFQVN